VTTKPHAIEVEVGKRSVTVDRLDTVQAMKIDIDDGLFGNHIVEAENDVCEIVVVVVVVAVAVAVNVDDIKAIVTVVGVGVGIESDMRIGGMGEEVEVMLGATEVQIVPAKVFTKDINLETMLLDRIIYHHLDPVLPTIRWKLKIIDNERTKNFMTHLKMARHLERETFRYSGQNGMTMRMTKEIMKR
jgi:hypothetical protein